MENLTLRGSPWLLADSGPQSGLHNMAIDVEALAHPQPSLRFFQWDKPTISYGYLLSIDHSPWTIDSVQRPTGGGIVYHQTTDLSLSILWPRGKNILPERPRAAYQAIHEKLKAALEKTLGLSLSLYVSCGAQSRNGVCFEEPVCNDIMQGGKKLVGGALRITRAAVLYQGNILLENVARLEELKVAVAREFI